MTHNNSQVSGGLFDRTKLYPMFGESLEQRSSQHKLRDSEYPDIRPAQPTSLINPTIELHSCSSHIRNKIGEKCAPNMYFFLHVAPLRHLLIARLDLSITSLWRSCRGRSPQDFANRYPNRRDASGCKIRHRVENSSKMVMSELALCMGKHP